MHPGQGLLPSLPGRRCSADTCTPAPIRSPRLTRLQGAEQPGRGPRDAAALLEHIAQDGAHATAALALQASPAATQGAGQFVLPHPRAPSAAPVLAAGAALERLRTQGSASPSRRGSLESCERAAGAPESRGSERADELRETGWHLQCGAQTSETRASWGGEEGGSERAGTQRRRRRLGTQSRHQPEKTRRSEPRSSEPARWTETRNKAGVPHTPKLGRDGGVAGARQQVPTWFEQPGEGKACPGQHEADLGAEKLADGDLNLQPKLRSCLSRPLREAKNHVK